MGNIVAAFGQSHVLFNMKGIEEQADVVFQNYKLIGERIRSANPDVLIVISGDHYYNISHAVEVPLAVSVANTLVPFGDMDCPKQPFVGHGEFGADFVQFGARRGFDLGKLHEDGYRPDHGVTVPLLFANPKGAIPSVAINLNINMDPPPSPGRAYELGGVLRDFILKERPKDERVAIIAAGGLSHWLNIARDGEINEVWDKQILSLFAEGRADELAQSTSDRIVKDAGNGGLEIIFWLMMAATVPKAKGTALFYEPVYPWKTGMGAIEMHVEAQAA